MGAAQKIDYTNPIDVIKAAERKAIMYPGWFCRDVLKKQNDPWQTLVMNYLADLDRKRLGEKVLHNHELKNRITIRSCHGPGKTHTLAKIAHWWNFTRKGIVVVTAPKEQQIRTRFFMEFRRVMERAHSAYKNSIDVKTLEATWFGEQTWAMFGETAVDPDNFSGYHDKAVLVLIDEASAQRIDKIYESIEGILTTPGSALVEIGNPTRTNGEFYNHHNKRGTKELYTQFHIKPTDSPRVSKTWLKNLERKYGKNSPVVKVRGYGEFADAEANQLIAFAYIEDAWDLEDPFQGIEIPRLRVTVDVADGGLNNTVITAALHYQQHVHVLKQKRYNFPPAASPIMAADAAIEMFNEFGGHKEQSSDDFVVDSIGVGAGTAGILLKKGYSVVIYRGGESSDNKDEWRNRRTQSYIALRNAYRDHRISFAPGAIDDELIRDEVAAQLCSIKTRPGAEKVEDLETKEQLVARLGGESPDDADSIAMHYATQLPSIGYDGNVSNQLYAVEGVGSRVDWNIP